MTYSRKHKKPRNPVERLDQNSLKNVITFLNDQETAQLAAVSKNISRSVAATPYCAVQSFSETLTLTFRNVSTLHNRVKDPDFFPKNNPIRYALTDVTPLLSDIFNFSNKLYDEILHTNKRGLFRLTNTFVVSSILSAYVGIQLGAACDYILDTACYPSTVVMGCGIGGLIGVCINFPLGFAAWNDGGITGLVAGAISGHLSSLYYTVDNVFHNPSTSVVMTGMATALMALGLYANKVSTKAQKETATETLNNLKRYSTKLR